MPIRRLNEAWRRSTATTDDGNEDKHKDDENRQQPKIPKMRQPCHEVNGISDMRLGMSCNTPSSYPNRAGQAADILRLSSLPGAYTTPSSFASLTYPIICLSLICTHLGGPHFTLPHLASRVASPHLAKPTSLNPPRLGPSLIAARATLPALRPLILGRPFATFPAATPGPWLGLDETMIDEFRYLFLPQGTPLPFPSLPARRASAPGLINGPSPTPTPTPTPITITTPAFPSADMAESLAKHTDHAVSGNVHGVERVVLILVLMQTRAPENPLPPGPSHTPKYHTRPITLAPPGPCRTMDHANIFLTHALDGCMCELIKKAANPSLLPWPPHWIRRWIRHTPRPRIAAWGPTGIYDPGFTRPPVAAVVVIVIMRRVIYRPHPLPAFAHLPPTCSAGGSVLPAGKVLRTIAQMGQEWEPRPLGREEMSRGLARPFVWACCFDVVHHPWSETSGLQARPY
ncbi:hypothetical protein SODALDRAFT_355919 [Sodiomyces alkalinus F11]|uniref:Uncharacterized protein n=1 Tax=Sodiomyces alkalinus (strain CBS 110278 / VKM F-3762 / F11) TaxID=1314773 RepID=A0A3N2QAF1_SODAK|nr:hypothetical protein SODALDRAFT_355919 [Sodiomyces alkalinus F11]ROT43697.1 hypothetical protein SODALDRAFT_355919 [Sodiomyces alkalinus F11]